MSEQKELIKEIEEYFRQPTAVTADLWLKRQATHQADNGVETLPASNEDLLRLQRETNDLISRNVRTSIIREGIHLEKRVVNEEVGGLRVEGFKQEVFLRPDVAPEITGQTSIEAVQYLQNPKWKDVDYDARLLIRIKGQDPLVVVFEKDKISRVVESIQSKKSGNGFGFEVSGLKQEVTRYNLSPLESRLVHNTLSGINSRLRDMRVSVPRV